MGMKSRKTPEKPDGRKIPKDERPKPTTGQSGAPQELSFADLNDDEKAVVKALARVKARVPLSVAELAVKCKNEKLYIRNAMRRLVRSGWVEGVSEIIADDGEVKEDARGHYRLTKNGKDRLRRKSAKRPRATRSNGVPIRA